MNRFLIVVLVSLCLLALEATGQSKQGLEWVGPKVAEQGFVSAMAKAYERYYGVTTHLQSGEQAQGIRHVAARKADFGASGRTKLEGVAEERLVRLVPVAWDALVAVTHPDNPVYGISQKQLEDILLGKLENWKDVGGDDAPIHLIMRENPLSDIEIALRQRLWDDPAKTLKADQKVANDMALYQVLANNPHALAIDSWTNAREQKVRILALNGVRPNLQNIENGSYPLFRPIYITYVSLKNPRRAEIKGMLKLAYSKEVKAAMRAHGLVPYLDSAKLVSLEKTRHSKRALAVSK